MSEIQTPESRPSKLDTGAEETTTWLLMREMQKNYFWQVYRATNHSIEQTAELLGIGRAGVYRYLGGAYDKQIQMKKRTQSKEIIK